MIYGSTGFTGRLIAQRAVEVGLAPVLAGRDEDRVRRQAEFLGTSWRTVSLDSIEALTEALSDIEAVVHAVEAQSHLRNFAGHVRNAPLDRAETASLLALLLADLMQLRPNGMEVLENQVGRVLAHRDYCVFATVALQYCCYIEL